MMFVANLRLPFADIVATATATSTPTLQSVFELRRVEPSPELPPGMSVEVVIAFVGSLSSSSVVYDFTFELRFVHAVSKGSPESGENLDAQSWKIGDGVLMIGTEDGDALQSRHPWFTFRPDSYPIAYLDDGIQVCIPVVPANRPFDFHFVLAFNSSDRGDDAEWFAVDIPHTKLIGLRGTAIRGLHAPYKTDRAESDDNDNLLQHD